MKPQIDDINHQQLLDTVTSYLQQYGKSVIARAYPTGLSSNDITSMLSRVASDLIVTDNLVTSEVEIKTFHGNKGYNIESLPLIEQILRHQRYPDYKFEYYCRRFPDGKDFYFNQDNFPKPRAIVITQDKPYPCTSNIFQESIKIWGGIVLDFPKLNERSSGDIFFNFEEKDMLPLEISYLKNIV